MAAAVPAVVAKGGLSTQEAQARLRQYGPNAVPEERPHPLLLFLRKFWFPVPWMLEVTLLLELALGRHTQAVIIAVLSFVQESRASNALALLRQRLTIQVRVLRDGLWRLAPAQDLVPGDVVHLRMGDLMPADVLLHDGHVLADQSALTGESAPGKPPMPAAPSGVARPPAKLRPPDGAPASARRRNWCEPPARPATWKP